MTDMLLIGLSALQAHQQALQVTSHNIANATTPGYTRQTAKLIASSPDAGTPGQVGRGVDVQAITRAVDGLLVERLRQAQSTDGRLNTLGTTLKSAQAVFNEPGDNGFSAQITNLFSAIQDLSNNPDSTALRSTTVAQMQSFASSLNSVGDQLAQLHDDLRASLDGDVAQVNQLTTEIADLNQQIRTQTLLGNSPNDLLDRRDQAVNDLSTHLELHVRGQSDGSVLIDSNGSLLVGQDTAQRISLGRRNDGGIVLLAPDQTPINAQGGSIGATIDLHDHLLPALQDQMDTVASSLALELNARNSTGTSSGARIAGYSADTAIVTANRGLDLDNPAQGQVSGSVLGIPAAYLPSFTDANGNPVARNLTINVLDNATGVAQKFTVRYDPTTGSGSRSLSDLVTAINTGRSLGGFTVYPPGAGGVGGVSARIVSADGGDRLTLSAASGKSIDFSGALDTRPASSAWTGGDATVTGSDASLVYGRVVFSVSGNTLQASTRSALDGSVTAYGPQITINASGPTVATVGGLTVTLPGGAAQYHDGESFAVDLTQAGAVNGGTFTQTAGWTQGDASMTIGGRYTGTQTFDPSHQWSMRVITPGTIGSATNPPLVEFTFFSGSASAPVQESVQKLLDDKTPAGTPVQIADGVFATFGAGALSAAGNQLNFTVDGQPDQARLLPALGINTLFSGATASTLQVSDTVAKNSNRIAVGTTRAAGDNSNLLGMAAVSSAPVFGSGGQTVGDFYNGAVAGLGVQVQQNTRLQDTQNVLKQSLENQRQQSSGVSIDEEVTYLIQQQQAYTAAARVISMARDNIQTLLGIIH